MDSSRLIDTRLDEALLEKATLREAIAHGARFKDARLREADLTNGDLGPLAGARSTLAPAPRRRTLPGLRAPPATSACRERRAQDAIAASRSAQRAGCEAAASADRVGVALRPGSRDGSSLYGVGDPEGGLDTAN